MDYPLATAATMSRPSFRPRPLDIHKKLPIVRSIKDLDIEDSIRSTDTAECDNLALTTPATKKAGAAGSEIPTPQYLVVDSYERDYTRSFVQPPSYIRGRPARSESAEFCEYDLDSDDEQWHGQFNSERKVLPAEKFEMMLYKLEIMDHKAAEKQGTLVSMLGSPIPVVLGKEIAIEMLKQVMNRPAVLNAVYDYWRSKRELWQKPILRRLQPPPPVNDTNPFNVFRPREKIHRPHTRRMQRRENDVQSFEKLRQVRYVIERSLVLVRTLQKREEKKREIVEVESNAQRVQLRLKASQQYAQYDALRMEDDGGGLMPSKFGRAEDGHRYVPRGDHMNGSYSFGRSMSMDLSHSAFDGSAPVNDHQDIRRPRRRPRFPQARNPLKDKMKSLDPLEPVFLFNKPLDAGKLAAAGIGFLDSEATKLSPYRFTGRIGRGGRLVYDRWHPAQSAGGSSPFDAHHHHPTSLSSSSIGAPVHRFIGARQPAAFSRRVVVDHQQSSSLPPPPAVNLLMAPEAAAVRQPPSTSAAAPF